MAVTLRDVALRAGVSPRTVSNVVNDFHHVSPHTRAKVQQALDDLDYRPNLLARSLRRGRTGIITLLVPDITKPYFGELAHQIVDSADAVGCTVMIDETGGDPERERALLDVAARSSWVDGVLLSSLGLQKRDLVGLGSAIPVVLLGERTAGTALDHVGIDNARAAREAVRHLLDSGRTRVAAVGGSAKPADRTSALRLRGYRQALRAWGLPPDGVHAETADYTRAEAAEAVHRLLGRDDPPDALFCFTDVLAAGALRQLHSEGVRVPTDVSVVGFDDVDEARFTVPSLTSVRPDKAGIARAAMDLLMQRIQGSQADPRDIRVPHELIVRESSTLG